MTYQANNTPAGTTEEPQDFVHSPVSRDFSRLLIALRSAVEAEIDTLKFDVFDEEFKDRASRAENAWMDVINIAQKILRNDAMRAEDDELRHVAAHISISTYLEHSEDCQAYQTLVRDYSPIFPCSADTAVGRRSEQMIAIAREWFKTLDWAVLGRDPRAEMQAAAM